MTINNMKDLENIVNKYIVKALELTRDEIFEILSNKIDEYYSETPIGGWGFPQYKNTDMLKNAKEKTPVSKIDNKFMFTVGFSDEYIAYEYPGWKVRFSRGNSWKNGVTGEEVLSEQFNAHMHGNPNFIGRHDYWDEFLEEIISRGGMDGILKNHLLKLGVPIK